MSPSEERRPPFAHTAMAKFLSRKLEEIKGEKTAAEISRSLGYARGNLISMFKCGEAKVPLDKIPALAKALEVDIAHLMRLGLEQYWPDKMAVISDAFGQIVTANELALLQEVRERTNNLDPKLTLENLQKLGASK